MHFLRCSKSNFTLVLITANQFITRTNCHLLIHLSNFQTNSFCYLCSDGVPCVRDSHTTPPLCKPLRDKPATAGVLGHHMYHKKKHNCDLSTATSQTTQTAISYNTLVTPFFFFLLIYHSSASQNKATDRNTWHLNIYQVIFFICSQKYSRKGMN